jgi:hypothetical protein
MISIELLLPGLGGAVIGHIIGKHLYRWFRDRKPCAYMMLARDRGMHHCAAECDCRQCRKFLGVS